MRFTILLMMLLLFSTQGWSKTKEKAVPFKSDWLKPFHMGGLAGRGRRSLEAQKPKQAQRFLRLYLRRKGAHERIQAEYLLAHAYLMNEDYHKAAELFGSLSKRYRLLEDYLIYYRALALYKSQDYSRAAEIAGHVDKRSVLKVKAALLRADALKALGRLAEQADIWREYLQDYPGGKQLGEAHFAIAEFLEKAAQDDPKQRQERLEKAIYHYKQVVIRAPLCEQASDANKRLTALAVQIPDGQKKIALDVNEKYRRAMGFVRKMRHKQAELLMSELLKMPNLDATLKCKAGYHWARSVARQRHWARVPAVFAAAVKACQEAKNDTFLVKCLFNGAIGLTRTHDFQKAIAMFGEIEKQYPQHSLADDARLWTAEVYETINQPDKAKEVLLTLPNRYPRGDMGREALWRVARIAIIQDKDQEALNVLERILDEFGRATIYFAEGQALYWKARLLDRLRKPLQAQKVYEQCIRDYPLSYYSLMAFNRLRERHNRLYRRLFRELIAKVGIRAGTWRLKKRAVYSKPGFRRGVELARLGFGSEAAREFERLGLGIRRGVPEDDLWLMAVLFDKAGLWYQSHRVPRSFDRSYRKDYPLGKVFRRWSVAYPKAFTHFVRLYGKREGMQPQLVWAIMREESGFMPTVESWANAVGLMQLLIRTAQRSSSSRMAVTRKRLMDPAVNIKLGCAYLGFLYRSFHHVPALAIAAYNAGEGAVLGWLKRFGSIPLDEFVDRIPYDQTRNYTKRVLSSLFTYSVLYQPAHHRIPRMSLVLPKAEKIDLKRPTRRKKLRKKNRRRRRRRVSRKR